MLRPRALELPPLLGELTHTLQLTLGQDLPCVFADEAHLDSALLNLALNARDAMPRGGVLRIEARAADGQVAVSVADNGEGMARETRAHACEPFFTTKGAAGTGLGLSMVQGFASQSGGSLRI